MFKRLLDLWHKDDLLKQAFGDAVDMLKLSRELFAKAAAPLFSGETADTQTIYDTDQKINIFEIEVRKKVLEHLSVSPQQDTTAALVLITIAVDVERLGDYSKNFFELWELYGKRFNTGYVFESLREVDDNITRMFENTIVGFENADSELARRVMASHVENSTSCESIIAEMIQLDKEEDWLTCNQRVLVALAARYLKRISAHLKNIASSVVNPFDRIGFKPPDSSGDIKEYED
ncbi:hypothetical protein DRQ36_09810 [bacterium]|nr:MAG: hypothetical protein DRQ36_09810 [bacterium]